MSLIRELHLGCESYLSDLEREKWGHDCHEGKAGGGGEGGRE